LAFIVSSLLFSVANAQREMYKPAEISWGQELKQPVNTAINKIITSPDGFYCVREKAVSGLNQFPNHVVLERYDKEMKLIKAELIDLKFKGKRRVYEDMILLGGQLYFLTSFNNQIKKKNYLFAQAIDNRRLTLDNALINIGEIDSKNKERTGVFGLHVSRDSSKILIYNELPYKKNSPEEFALRVYDENLNELWTKNIVLPYSDAQFGVEEYRIDNNGNVYLLGALYESGTREVRRGKPNFKYIILTYTNDGEKMEEYKISLSNKFITDLTFRVADNGDLVCSGFFSDIGTYSVKGTYFFRLNPETRQITNQNQKEFDFDFLTESMTDRQREKAKKAKQKGNKKKQAELFQYALDHLILRSDGGAVLIAEQYYAERISVNENPLYAPGAFTTFSRNRYYGNQYDRFYYNYNYNDIIIVNIKPNGEIEWATRIPKRQESTDDAGYFSSYAMSIIRDKFFFVYNENPKNFDPEKKPNRVYGFDRRQSVVACTQVSKDGSIKTVPLCSNRDADIITRPKMCKQTSSNHMVIYGERNRKYKFAKLTFNK